MKKVNLMMAVTAVVVALIMAGCGSSKPAASSLPGGGVASADEEFVEPPCTYYDDENVFTGSSSAYGSAAQEAVIRRTALANAQSIVRQKMKHAYQGMVSDYFNLIGNNAGNTARSNIEGAGDQIIDAIVNDTQEKCIRRSKKVDDKGNITYYIGIVINKKEAANTIADGLSEDEELEVRFHESNYRERLQEKFKEYKEGQRK
jgi:hypothetical protein